MRIVTSCPRSGTTLVMKMLQACGAELGDVVGVNEHRELREGITKPYLRSIGHDALGQSSLPTYDELTPMPDFRDKVLQATIGADIVKDNKITLLWPLWHEHFPDAKWLLVYRDPEKIAESCVRTNFMHYYATKAEWLEWVEEYHKRCYDLEQVADVMWIEPARIVKGDTEHFRRAIDWLGFEWNERAVLACFNKDKWHG